jgi:predicted DNA-binding mobile mystery protein A
MTYMNRREAAAEARRSLDRTLSPFQNLSPRRPAKGWIRAIRDAFGMTAAQLGERMGVSQPTVQGLETSEADDVIQLKTLRRAAEALGCELVYALVPKASLDATYTAAAQTLARRELARIDHSMTLEDQAVADADADDRVRRFIETELDPREVWARRP